MRVKLLLPFVLCLCLSAFPSYAQQKGQYMPGAFGLNAGVLPSPGLTYENMEVNYDTSTLNDPSGKAINPKPNLNLWVVENWFIYMTNAKFLGGHIGFVAIIPMIANASIDLSQLNKTGTTWGLSDTWLQPLTLGWHLKRADTWVGDAFFVPIGRYSPGALNNTGTGYFGNHLVSGTTVYLSKNKGTSANLFSDWEVHGPRQGTNGTYKTPGQAFTDEWGFGQALPLKKDMSALAQLGVIGYDQWQVTNNGGTFPVSGPLGNVIILPASAIPHYSVHAVGGQGNIILPTKNLLLFFKYEHEYSAYAHTLGNTMVFGGSWTLKIPK